MLPKGAAAILARYTAISSLGEFSFPMEQGAQQRLKIAPRGVRQWLGELGLWSGAGIELPVERAQTV